MLYYNVKIYDYDLLRDYKYEGILLDNFLIKATSIEDLYKKLYTKYQKKFTTLLCKNKQALLEYLDYTKANKGIYLDISAVDESIYTAETTILDDFCFNCGTKIHGKESSFPKEIIYLDEDNEEEMTVHFCSHSCKKQYLHATNPTKYPMRFKAISDSYKGIFGYVYRIYNRRENKYYVGQCKNSPFKRFYEHVKSLQKGELSDLEFSIIAEIPVCNNSKALLNDTESFWINKYLDEGFDVFNIVEPKISKNQFIESYNNIMNSGWR